MEENYKLSHLRELEAESIHIIREVAAEFENPVMLYSIGKDSSVMVRLAEKAFYPGKVPFPLMHIDSKWKFREMIEFRDQYAKEHGWNLIVESNMEAFNAGVGPFTHGSKVHTDLMKTQALLHGLNKYRFDAAFGGARRDEEKSRAKERIFSFRDRFHQWDPKNQRPELWDIYNAKIHKGESIRVFPLSNWTELDIWQYIRLENIPIVPLYFAKERPVVNIDGNLIMADDDRLPEEYRDRIEMKKVRFRTLGCWPLTGAVERVSKDAAHPFKVEAGAIIVQVLGTHFNVEAYPEDTQVKTTLLEGSVSVSLIGKAEESLILSPNESAIYNKDKKSLTLHTENNASEEIIWRNGTLLFKSIPLQEIVRQLSNAFHTDIRIEDADLQNYRMTATFSDGETLEEILSLLCRNQKFEYTKTNDIITITQKLN